MATKPSSVELINNYGIPCDLVPCRCCEVYSLYEIPMEEDTFLLCSWCDVENDKRWQRL